MAGTLSATINAAAKEIVYNELTTQYKEDDAIFTYLGMDAGADVEVNDRGVRFVSPIRPNPSGGAFTEGGALAVAGTPSYVSQTCGFTEYSMTMAFSGRAIELLKDPNNLLKGLQPIIDSSKKTLRSDFSQYVFEDGKGIKAVRSSTSPSGTTVTFATTTAAGSTFGARRVLVGGRYNFINPASGAIRAGGGTSVCTVSSINQSAATVTFDAIPNDTATGDYLVRENTYNKAIRGFPYAVSSNALTLYNVSRADYPELNSNVFSASTTMSQSIARRMDYIMEVRVDTDMTMPIDIIVGTPQKQALEEIYHPLVRVDNEVREGKIGITKFSIGGRPVIREHWCDDDKMYFICKDSWLKLFLHPIKVWESPDGQIFHAEPQVSATGSGGSGVLKDNFLMSLVFRGDLFCKSPRHNGVVTNLTLGSELVRPYTYS